MLNLDETLFILSNYNIQRDLFIRGIGYFVGVALLIETIRKQIPEVNILQLVPGFYLFLLLLSFLLLVFSSDFFARLSLKGDSKKEVGTKTLNRMKFILLMKTRFFLFSTVIIVLLNTVIPLSLDSFNNYGERTVENVWSFDEVINLETILLSLLILLSQSPIIAISSFTTEKDTIYFPGVWKIGSFFLFVISGLLTPTIDGYTQISFAVSAIFLYIFVLTIIQKRITVKNSYFSVVGS
jgi:hypothetical protein